MVVSEAGPPSYFQRLIDPLLDELMAELPSVLLVGPRATGKTTTAERHAETVVRLDREAEAAAFHADPDAALRDLVEPVLLDEWQAAPEALAGVKRSVDRDPRPGRYILTGSVRSDLDVNVWPGTGRLVRIPMVGLTMREQLGRTGGRPFFNRLDDGDEIEPPNPAPDLRDYVDIALRSGFPEAVRLSERVRRRWLDSYIDQLLTHDVELVDGGRDPARLRRYFEAYSLKSAGMVEDKTLIDAAGINRKTAIAYEQLLKNLLVVESVPAWRSNRLKRLVASPKRYVVDPALIAAALSLDVSAVMRDGELLGRMLDSLVMAQLRAEVTTSRSPVRLFHLREKDRRHEIDVVAELTARRVIAMEIKATAAPATNDARHLVWLRDRLGEAFAVGVVFHTGPRVYELGDRILAAPIGSLWA